MIAAQAPTVRIPLDRRLQVAPASRQRRFKPVLFWILMAYFVLEYARPPGIVNLRLQMIFLILLFATWALQPPRTWSRNLTLQVVLLALCGASVLYAHNNFAAYIATRIVVGNVIIAIAITWLMADRRNFVSGIWFWIVIFSYQAFHGIGHMGYGTGGFLGDENDLALGCATTLPFALIGFLRFRGWRRWASGAFATLFTVAVVTGSSRGGFVGLVAAALVCFLAGRNRIRNLLIAAVVGLVFYFSVSASYRQEMSTMSETKSGTADARMFLWAAAVNMWSDHKLLGVGAGNFRWLVGVYQPKPNVDERFSGGQYQSRDWSMTVTHSMYFEALSELGIVGSVALAMIIAGHFTGLWRMVRRVQAHPGLDPDQRNEAGAYAVALSAAMVGYLAAGAFLSALFFPYLWYLSAMAVAWERVVDRQLLESKLRKASVPL